MDCMPVSEDNKHDQQLNKLWADYRDALPDVEASSFFMPKLWQRIETRRSEPLSIFRRLAEVCVMATLALALLMSVIMPEFQKDPGVAGTYVDVLADEQSNAYTAMLVEDVL